MKLVRDALVVRPMCERAIDVVDQGVELCLRQLRSEHLQRADQASECRCRWRGKIDFGEVSIVQRSSVLELRESDVVHSTAFERRCVCQVARVTGHCDVRYRWIDREAHELRGVIG